MFLSWWTGSLSGAAMLSSQEVNISVMVDGESQRCYRARFIGSQYLCHGGWRVPLVQPCKVTRKSIFLSWQTGSPSGATMLGSQEVNISVMADWDSQWCYHVRLIRSQYLYHGGLGVPVVLPSQVDRKAISLSWPTGSPSGASMIGSQDLNISAMSDGESQWCYHASFLGPHYLSCRSSISLSYFSGATISLSCLSGTTMLGSQDLNIAVMSDWESQWCYHARLLGTQYICHDGLGVLVVLPCQVPRKSISLSWRTGSPSGVTILGSQEVDISDMSYGESQGCYHASFLGSRYLCHGGLGVPVVLPCQVPRTLISLSCRTSNISVNPQWCYNISIVSQWTSISLLCLICATMLGSQDLNIYVMSDGVSQQCYHARFIGSQYLRHGELGHSGATMLGILQRSYAYR